MSEAVGVALANGSIAIVDSEDEHLVTGYAWYEAKGRSTSYAACTTGPRAKKTRIQMHRLIIGARDAEIVDHVNGNGLDNRRANLRIATNSQNLMNRGPSKINNSGFKGVSLCKSTGRWKAEITVEGERTWLGRFETPEEAALAYDAKARVLFKDFAYLNFPTNRDCTCKGTGEITVSDGYGGVEYDACPRCSWFEPYTDDYPTADDAVEVPF